MGSQGHSGRSAGQRSRVGPEPERYPPAVILGDEVRVEQYDRESAPQYRPDPIAAADDKCHLSPEAHRDKLVDRRVDRRVLLADARASHKAQKTKLQKKAVKKVKISQIYRYEISPGSPVSTSANSYIAGSGRGGFPTASFSGMRSIWWPRSPVITPDSPSASALRAAVPMRLANTRSNALGLPPRWTCPSTVRRDSNAASVSFMYAWVYLLQGRAPDSR